MKTPDMPPPPSQTTQPAIFTVPAPSFHPPRIVLNAVEGWGKTTAGAFAPKPAFLTIGPETGYHALLDSARAPAIPTHHVTTWADLLSSLRSILSSPGTFETIVLDTIGAAERLCHEHVCHNQFRDDWGDKGFMSYQKGYDLALVDWTSLLALLDQLRSKGLTVLLLGHTAVRTFKNPVGADYDQFASDMNAKTSWPTTRKWADLVLFGNYITVLENVDTKGKKAGAAIGGYDRILYTTHRDAWDAKSRYPIPSEIRIPDDHTTVWATIWNAIRSCIISQ